MNLHADEIESILRQAGKLLLSSQAKQVEKKTGDANFVTEWDVTIQKFLQEKLSELFPEAAFFGEEDTEGNLHGLGKGYTFIIDPIDGTTNFIFGYRHSCISVALALGEELVAGFVYNPYSEELFRGQKGQGAYLNGQRLVMENREVSRGIVSFGCARYQATDIDHLFSVVKELFFRSLSIRDGGSAAIDLCRVSSGSNVAYLELKLQPYDFAAAALLIREAGGIITQLDGSPVTLDQPCSILAGTPAAHREILDLYSSWQQS